MLTDTWRDILETAQRAPSPHNVQPWKVKILSEDTCEVYIENFRTLPKEDTTGSFIISGMVMYLETMRYAAQTCQHELTYDILEVSQVRSEKLVKFATVSIRKKPSIIPEFERDVILRRRTSRLEYSPHPIPADHREALQQLVTTYGHTYGALSDQKIIEQILNENTKALFHDFNSPNYHDEIVSWFRFTKRSSLKHKDGLDYRCMRIPATDYYLSARYPMLLKLPLLSSIFTRRYRHLIGRTPCVAWLSGKFWTPAESIVAGKLLMHFWLEMTRLGLYLHPMGNLVTNRPARDNFESLTGSRDVWFVFRMGYTDIPPESYRRSVEQVLIGDET